MNVEVRSFSVGVYSKSCKSIDYFNNIVNFFILPMLGKGKLIALKEIDYPLDILIVVIPP